MGDAPHALHRIHYFAGQILTAEDFQAEQDYHLERWRRHNRWCHGWGVVTGLDLAIEGKEIVVTPGMALDCAGNEVVVPKRDTLRLPLGRTAVYLLLCWAETPGAPVPGLAEPADTSSMGGVSSRIAEGGVLTWAAADPGRAHRQRGGKWETCGEAHGVALGRLLWTRGRWRVDRRFRLRRACGSSSAAAP
jgi:hypothetical protein